MTSAVRTVACELAKGVRVAREDGPEVAVGRVFRKGLARLRRDVATLPLFLDDVVLTDGRLPDLLPRRRLRPDEPMLVDWVMTPPSPGSGGHTTVFRIVEELERRGHRCRLSLYDRYRGDLQRQTDTIRQFWPGVAASTHDAASGLLPADVTFATSWETAHVVARRAAVGLRAYFVQDHEPDFHPLGSERVLAEATYRFGFVGVAAGRWLAEHLEATYGMPCVAFDFGCDTAVYRCDNMGPRSGVVFYAKPDVPRRAFWLGALALRTFADRRPDQEVHLFGAPTPRLDFPHVHHGSLSPEALNRLYNTAAAGLSLSLTNVSLVPWEMLSSGCLPVVNDAPHNRRVLDNPHVQWSSLQPGTLAEALRHAVGQCADAGARLEAARSVQQDRWDAAGATVEHALRTLLCRE